MPCTPWLFTLRFAATLMQRLTYPATESIWLCLVELYPLSLALASVFPVCGARIVSAQAVIVTVFFSFTLCLPEDGNVHGVMLPLP